MEIYPISSLYLNLPSAESREQFKNFAKRDSPVLNRAKKKWADPSKLNLKPEDRVEYLVFDGKELTKLTMSALEASNVNFPEKDTEHDALPEVPWPCRALMEDERIVTVDGAPMVQKGAE